MVNINAAFDYTVISVTYHLVDGYRVGDFVDEHGMYDKKVKSVTVNRFIWGDYEMVLTSNNRHDPTLFDKVVRVFYK